jgi:hypothetical protein
LEGGKIQKAFKAAEKHARKLSDAFEDNKNMAQIMTEAFEDTPFEKLKYFSNSIGKVIDKTGVLEQEFKGLGLSTEKTSEIISSLEGLTGMQLGDSTKKAMTMGLGGGGSG